MQLPTTFPVRLTRNCGSLSPSLPAKKSLLGRNLLDGIVAKAKECRHQQPDREVAGLVKVEESEIGLAETVTQAVRARLYRFKRSPRIFPDRCQANGNRL
jgi:hypothetical protein